MLKFIPKISSFTNKLNRFLTYLPACNIHHDGTEMPRQYNFYWKPQHRKILYDKKARIIKMQQRQHHDILVLPGYNEQNIHELFTEYKKKKVNLSSQNVAMLINMFIKYNIMTFQIFDTIEKQAYKLKGQYKIRSIFGALRGSILFNRQKLIEFFIQQYKATDQKFTMHEMLQILEAVNQNRYMSNKDRLKIWEEFKPDFVDGLMSIRIKNVDFLSRIFDFLQKIKEKDQNIWERIIKLMRYKKGWDMIPVFERLYAISGQFQSAKKQFDYYYQKMSEDQKILQRYNITQLRSRTPLEVIKYIQQNPTEYHPKIRTLVPEGYDANQWNEKYQQFLKVGSIKQQQQIIKDKSKSLGFAIKQRYQSLSADGLDFSKMNKQQFSQMFGDYDSAITTIKQAQQELERQQNNNQSTQNEQEQEQQQEQQQQQQKENKKQKGKKEAKQGNKGDKGEKQQKDKHKKQKGNKQQKKQKQKKKKQ